MNKNGYTLFELMVALAVMAMLTLLVSGLFSETLNRWHLKSFVAGLSNAIQQSKIKAHQTFTPKSITYSNESQQLLFAETGEIDIPDGLLLSFQQGGKLVEALEVYPDGSSSGGLIEIKYANTSTTYELSWLNATLREISHE